MAMDWAATRECREHRLAVGLKCYCYWEPRMQQKGISLEIKTMIKGSWYNFTFCLLNLLPRLKTPKHRVMHSFQMGLCFFLLTMVESERLDATFVPGYSI